MQLVGECIQHKPAVADFAYCEFAKITQISSEGEYSGAMVIVGRLVFPIHKGGCDKQFSTGTQDAKEFFQELRVVFDVFQNVDA